MTSSDHAYTVFASLLPELRAWAAGEWSEADTRVKLIDALFIRVLGWAEQDIVREQPVADGYADYAFGRDYRHLHVEAKRSNPRWQIHAASEPRLMKLSGPHLLGNRGIKEDVLQAARYSFELGTGFALLTNGTQFILFRTHVQGHSWRDFHAMVWHSLDDILANFAEFYDTLARDRIVAGSLHQLFERAEAWPRQVFTPIDYVHNASAELVRNPFWSKIAKVLGPLLTDDPGNPAAADEVIRNCYVTTPLSDETDKNIDSLLRDDLPAYLASAGVKNIRPGMHGNTAFGADLENDIKSRRLGTYILTGGVGSGKTTFLRRYATVVAASLVREYCIWLHADFIPIGNVGAVERDAELRRFTFATLRDELRRRYVPIYPSDGHAIRSLFAREIDEAGKTALFGIDESSADHTRIVNAIVEQLWSDDERVVTALLSSAKKRGLRPVVVFDNTDQLGEDFQAAVFLLAQRVSDSAGALAIVALREEKFFAAYRRGVFDAFGDRRFHIGSPDLSRVIRTRLQYGLSKFAAQANGEAATAEERDEVAKITRVIDCLIRSTTANNQNIVRYLSCVSNGDMRYALGAFRDFISSGNTNVEKIVRAVEDYGGYTVPFHEFAKSAILGSKRYYHNSSAKIVNVFLRSSAPGASHLTGLRLLARLSSAAKTPSSHGEGYVSTTDVLSEFRRTFGRSNDLISRSEEILLKELVETEPPRVSDLEKTDALKISAAGEYYWRYLARSFAYLDLVFLDTPIDDRTMAQRLGTLGESADMAARFERVRLFLDYLAAIEAEEIRLCGAGAAGFAQALIPELQNQIEREFEWIRGRLQRPDL